MIVDTEIRSDYPSDVRLWLEASGRSWPIAKIGPGHFVPAERFELKPCTGDIVMMVDGHERRWTVQLSRGVCFFDSFVAVSLR